MTIVVLTNCPPKLRGDMTKWFVEVNTGVYVGQVSSRVRLELWNRICDNIKTGQATMVFSAQNEQRMDFWVHNTTWKPMDFDGIKLMCRPVNRLEQEDETTNLREGFSKAARIRKRGSRGIAKHSDVREEYIVLDLETTALRPSEGKIIEIGGLLVQEGKVSAEFSRLIRVEDPLPKDIVRLTGITDDMVRKEGVSLKTALEDFIGFAGDRLLVCHNVPFEQSFINASMAMLGMPLIENRWKDTLILARKKLRSMPNYQLGTLLKALDINSVNCHRAVQDAQATQLLYEKLKEI